jgi:alanyl aminopeptidase
MNDPLRLGLDVVPASQAIHLCVDASRKEFSGLTRIELDVREDTESFRFHAREMTLHRLVLRGVGKLEVSAGEKGTVTARAPRRLTPGRYTLEAEFSAPFNTQAAGLYRLEAGGDAYTFTQFEADDARGAFPCWDEPRFKIPFQLTLTVPEEHAAVSNTPEESTRAADGWKTIVFQRTKPLPTYLLAIATGPLESVPVPNLPVPGRIFTVRGQSHLTAEAAKVTPPILRALEDYFGRPYPYEKLDQIAIPEFWPGAMENAGAVTYADHVLLLDSRAASAAQRRTLVTIVAHELSHMWFGNLVTMEWWDDLWLNESFASWLGDKISEQLFPELGVAVEEVNGATRAMLTDAKLSTRAIRQPVHAADNLMHSADELAYQKGQRVLGMFERWIGPDTFRDGVRRYLAAHEWGNARAADLWAALTAAAGRDLAAAMATFLDQGGMPLVSVERFGGQLRLSQRRFVNFGVTAPAASWLAPVTIKLPGGVEHSLLLAGEPQTLSDSAPPAWIHPNAGEHGYYRWKTPLDMLQALTANGAGLQVRERVGLLSNVSALLDAGELPGDDYLGVLERFAADEAPDVVGGVLDALNKVRLVFVTEDLDDSFAAWLRRHLAAALERFGWEKGSGEPEAVSFVRPRLLYWLADEGRDAPVMAQAQELTAAFLHDPASVDPALSGAALRAAATRGDAALFAAYCRHFETTTIPADRRRVLAALGEFRDPGLVERALAYALEGPLRPQEILTIPTVISHGHRRYEDYGLAWVIAHYQAIVARIPPEYVAFLPDFADGCSLERLERARAFFSDPARQVAGTLKELAKVADAVTNNVSLREREAGRVAARLKPAAR